MKRTHLLLAGIFMLVFGVRLFLAYSLGQYSYDAYEHIRQIEHIRDTGVHLVNDPLSYGGRTVVVLPFFHYLLGFLSMVLPLDFVLTFFPNLFASTVVFIGFALVLRWTKNELAALFGAFVTGFTPLFFSETLVSVSPFSLFVPLSFLLFYSFMQLHRKRFLLMFIILSFILPLVSIYSLVIVMAFLIYLLFAQIEDFKFKGRSRELTLFFSFLSFWIILLMFKKPLLQYGPRFVSAAVPDFARHDYFFNVGFLQLFGGFGILSLIAGTYIIYISLFERNDRRAYLLFSFISAALFFVWISALKSSLGLSLVGLCLSLFSGIYFDRFFQQLTNTKFARYRRMFIGILFALFALSSGLVTLLLSFDVPVVQDAELRVLDWARLNTPRDATIAAPVYFGNLITAVAQRKNVADEQYLLAPDAAERLSNIRSIYFFIQRYSSTTFVINRMYTWGADYIYIPFGSDDRVLRNDAACFELVYNKEIKVYKVLCRPLQVR